MAIKTSKLSIKLLWYITPLVILPLLFLGGFTLTNVTSATQKQTQLTVSRFVEQQQQKMFNYIEIYQSTTKLLSASPLLNEYLSQDHTEQQAKQEHAEALIDVFSSYNNAYPDILSINLLNNTGQSEVYHSVNLGSAPDNYIFSKEIITSHLRQQQFMVPTQQGSTHLFIVQRVYGINLELKRPVEKGYLVVQIDPSIISSSILESAYENTLNLIVTGNGKIIFSSTAEHFGHYLNDTEVEKIHQYSDSGILNTMTLSSLDENERMFFAVQVSGGYYYISTIPKTHLYQSGKTISLITALIVLLSIIALPILIFIVVRNLLLNPIELLAQASHRVGDGDLSVRLPTQGDDEVGALFDDFNYMVKQISDFQGQLEGFKEHLEFKVDERTQELESANAQLELAINEAHQANELKSRFLANMSHEIRTPLTAIIGFTEQLLIQSGKHDHLKIVLRNSKHLLELINNILDLSKIEAEKLAVEQTSFNIQHLIEDIHAIASPLANEKQLSFDIHYTFPLPQRMYSDLTRLKQILLNIASNAIKFTEYGGVSLNIRFDAANNMFSFIIQDSGIGMSENEVNRIFKPFEQADSTTTRRFGGTGLGLCISKNLAQLLGGDIYVQSEQGLGSQFHIKVSGNYINNDYKLIYSLPKSAPNTDVAHELAQMHITARILVAEDNLDNQALVTLLLERWGITPDIVNNGAEAVEKALVNDYDLVLMDMQMPVMGGVEATKMLRSAAYTGPIIALTANVMKHDVDTYIQSGCDSYLAKPIDTKELGKVLLEFLQIQAINNSQWDSLLQSDKFTQINKTYVSKLPDYLAQVECHHKSQDWETLRVLAHSLKGSAGCFGFMNVYSAADALEVSLKSDHQSIWQYKVLSLIEAIKFSINETV